jgi:hypothetical protein
MKLCPLSVQSVVLRINVGVNIRMGKEKLFSEIFNKYDQEPIVIDRDAENKAIMEFQKTDDMRILEDVYIKRIPTLKVWALRFYYPGLELSIDDFMEELSIVFIKCANKYNIEKGSFNTSLYTYLNNRIKNMKNSTHAKKRRPVDYDGPVSGILLSLDHAYSSDGNSGETTLADILLKEEGNNTTNMTDFQETVHLLSNGNEVLRSVFVKLGEGSTLSSIIRDIKTFKGDIKVSSKELRALEENDYTSLKDIIVKKEKIQKEFTVVDYDIDKKTITYSIEYKETEESTLVQKTIKDLRKNKDEYMRKINQD